MLGTRHLEAFANNLDRRWYRYRTYAVVAGVLYLLSLVAVSFKPVCTLIVSDGRSYYVYLPSLFIDGDLDFGNQISEHWDVDFRPEILQDRTPIGLVRNRYPIGFSLTLVPGFVAAHALSHVAYALTGLDHARPDGYSILYQLVCLAQILFLGLLSFVAVDRICCHHLQVPGRYVGIAVLFYWLATPHLYYFFREPFMVHVVSAFWVVAVAYFSSETLRRLEEDRPIAYALAAMGVCGGMAVVCRPTNALVLPLFVYAMFGIGRRRGLRGCTAALWWLPGIVPLVLQMGVWRVMAGRFIYYSYADVGFDWLRPALWQVLLSSRHGLFFWAPSLAFAMAGLFLKREVRNHPTVACLLVGAVVLWYANAAWQVWWFGDAFGARSFLECQPLFVIGFAAAFWSLSRTSRGTRAACAALLALCAVYNSVLLVLYIALLIPRSGALL